MHGCRAPEPPARPAQCAGFEVRLHIGLYPERTSDPRKHTRFNGCRCGWRLGNSLRACHTDKANFRIATLAREQADACAAPAEAGRFVGEGDLGDVALAAAQIERLAAAAAVDQLPHPQL